MAPAFHVPSMMTSVSGMRGRKPAMRSPGATPSERSTLANRLARALSSSYVSVLAAPSLPNQQSAGRAEPAWRSTRVSARFSGSVAVQPRAARLSSQRNARQTSTYVGRVNGTGNHARRASEHPAGEQLVQEVREGQDVDAVEVITRVAEVHAHHARDLDLAAGVELTHGRLPPALPPPARLDFDAHDVRA